MNAIAAIVRWDGREVTLPLLRAVNDCVHERFPDGSWSWSDGSIGMAQADLATLPEDGPGKPVQLEGLRIAASCRLDNREELRSSLTNYAAREPCPDAALILSAYRAWGESCLGRIVGDFAFVIWDPHQRHLFAARDVSGVRPLYYFVDQARIFLATERLQIMQDPSVPIVVNEEHILEYLTPTYQWATGWEQGGFRGFHALPAGAALSVECGKIRIYRFWNWLEPGRNLLYGPDAVEGYLETLKEAVRCRLRSRGPVALELSGGLDSTAIACLAARATSSASPALHTLSDVFDEFGELDERVRIQSVLERYPDLSPHFLPADFLYGPQGFASDWFEGRSIPGPMEFWFPPARKRSYEVAEGLGCRVLLTGEGGNELNDSSRAVYFSLLRRSRYREALRQLRIQWVRRKTGALREFFLDGMGPMLPEPLLRLIRAVRGCLGQARDLPDYIAPSVRKRILEVDRAILLERARSTGSKCPTVRATLSSLFPPMVGVTAPTLRLIECRHPYYDRRLIQLVLTIAPEFKYEVEQPGLAGSRWHHRTALAGSLPDQVRVGNPGIDFSPAVRRGLAPQIIRKWLTSHSVIHLFENGYVIPDIFWRSVDEEKEPEGYLMSMLCLEGWLRTVAPDGKLQRYVPQRKLG